MSAKELKECGFKFFKLLVAFKNSKDSVYKVRRPQPVLYDSLEPIETCTAWAKNMQQIFDSFKCNVYI